MVLILTVFRVFFAKLCMYFLRFCWFEMTLVAFNIIICWNSEERHGQETLKIPIKSILNDLPLPDKMGATDSKSLTISFFRWPVCVSRENLAGTLIFSPWGWRTLQSKKIRALKNNRKQHLSFILLIANFETKSIVKFACYKLTKTLKTMVRWYI